MTFQFVNFNEFLVMGGHGGYVWAAYGLTIACLLGLAIKIRVDAKSFYKLQASIAKRNPN